MKMKVETGNWKLGVGMRRIKRSTSYVPSVLSVLLVLLFGAIVWASCDHTYSNTTPSGNSGAIGSSAANYYRGEIYPVDTSRGICKVTAYLSTLTGNDTITAQNFTMKIWSLNGTNLGSILRTSDDIYLGGNWIASAKTFHFYNPILAPAGYVAITIDHSGNSTTQYAGWDQGAAQTGHQSCSWNSNGIGADAIPALEVQLSDLNYATDTDNTTLTWTTGGSGNWTIQTSGSHDGVDVARSAAISDSQETWIATTVAGPGDLTFWWKVSSENNYDFLSFYIDGELQTGRISGPSHDWEQKSYSLVSGTHVLKWTYAKDLGVNLGTDQAWLDQVTYSNLTPPHAYIPAMDGNCTATASQLMEIKYVELPFLTANPIGNTYTAGGHPYFFTPDATLFGNGWIEIADGGSSSMCRLEDNVTIACELPNGISSGPHRVLGRFWNSDGNESHCSCWSSPFRYRKSPEGTIANHSDGEIEAILDGGYH